MNMNTANQKDEQSKLDGQRWPSERRNAVHNKHIQSQLLEQIAAIRHHNETKDPKWFSASTVSQLMPGAPVSFVDELEAGDRAFAPDLFALLDAAGVNFDFIVSSAVDGWNMDDEAGMGYQITIPERDQSETTMSVSIEEGDDVHAAI